MMAILEWLGLRVALPAAFAVGAWLWVGHVESAAFERGADSVREEVAAMAKAAQAQNDEQHRRELEQVKEAQDARDKKLQAVEVDHGRALRELDGLRKQIALARDLPATGTGASACDCAAERELQRVLGEELERVSAAGARLAREADGHGADAVMLQRACRQ